ncbi:MAG: ATP-grasp domain-containing protein [Fibrella sp.]|nr:ATP-grasp domain-containing protein [Armatimonadota bacterium]
MIVLAEAVEQMEPSASARDVVASTEAARLAGATVYTMPADFSVCETAEIALHHVPKQGEPTPAFWIGYIPEPGRYEAIYNAARSKNIVLANTRVQHLNAQEFDRTYPKLAELTARSVVVSSADFLTVTDAVESVGGFPVFVKGAVQSRKSKGWKACVAESLDELHALIVALLDLSNRSRGRVILRELLPLRIAGYTPNGFPMGREFRVFVYNGVVVGTGYYWETASNEQDKLTSGEKEALHALATEAARRVGTPYIAVDIGQLTDSTWRVIETGDAQFSGLSQIPKIALWNALRRTL